MTATPSFPLIRALMECPACFDHPVADIRLIETHISWVLLTGDYAYKIKKPVNLGFLDFSELALRKQACEEEIRLNRRLAPDYYLGVVGIAGSPQYPCIGGDGEAFEYAVKMRQFPPMDTLDRLAAQGGLHAEQIDRLAARIAHFHSNECEVATAAMPWGEPEVILRPMLENFEPLEKGAHDPAARERLKSLREWALAEHGRLAPLMAARKRDGYVRECHGDLHLGNLAWVDGELVIFDAIEFSAALRWIDVISEVAFCFMDLLHRGYAPMAWRFLNAWLEATGDYVGIALLRYYAVYRAMVRAKVAALRLMQLGEVEARREVEAELESCLELAERLVQPLPSRLWITHGLSGSGKTTVTQQRLQHEGMIRLRSDVERKRLAGLAATEASGSGLDAGLYSADFGQRTYERLAVLSDALLRAGWPVIVDAACLARWQRDLFREVAQTYGAEFRILDFRLDLETLRERIAQRLVRGGDASEADLAVLQRQIESQQPLAADELGSVEAING